MSNKRNLSKGNEIRLGVIGAEGRGGISRLAHKPDEGVRLVAAMSLTLDNLDIYREKCGEGIRLTTDRRSIIDDPEIDAVFICSPDHLHEEHAVEALEAGKGVFLEKPMAISIEGCDSILRTAGKTGSPLYVGHNMRFFPVMRKMHELITAGRIGEVEAIWCRHFVAIGGEAYFKDWHSERKYSNSLLLQKGAHDIDMIHWFAGAYTRRVVGMGKLSVYNRIKDRRDPQRTFVGKDRTKARVYPPLTHTGMSPVIEVEDLNSILMQLDNGVQATYMECHYTPDYTRNYTIIGTEGRIENYGSASSEEKWATVHLWNRRMGFSEQGNEVFRIPHVEGSHGGADPLMIADFIRFLRGEPRQGAEPIDARMAVATGCKGAESIRNANMPQDVDSVSFL